MPLPRTSETDRLDFPPLSMRQIGFPTKRSAKGYKAACAQDAGRATRLERWISDQRGSAGCRSQLVRVQQDII